METVLYMKPRGLGLTLPHEETVDLCLRVRVPIERSSMIIIRL